MKIFTAKQLLSRKNYKSERMTKIRGEVLSWMQEYETANIDRHRQVCMDMIQRKLKQYEWYGKR